MNASDLVAQEFQRRVMAAPYMKNRVVFAARHFLGVRYQLGGDDYSGIDCSGLVSRAYKLGANRTIPHSAAEIIRMGVAVPVEELRAGDVVYNNKGAPHVGLYDGRGGVIHATSIYGRAVSEPLDVWFKKGWYEGSRRIV